ncbi:Hypothetical protein DEACI_4031 [Acididesulfobacillus acetoxydans]|uniref:Uncharacterized protein n=1 Tax=Acididesulfobacillus acetoxydans TaxID=1561005 RepID=A0A8S0W5J5_9FIRM|nr:hypothetical protein [Acididesulfobacillus acetoxydans]CAA7603208.1 Hypothetical protein DEACI_4031 [Acididesulfobacillus acetoxydans]
MTAAEFQELILQKFSTLEQNMATKQDLSTLEQNMATKQDLSTLEQKLTQVHESQVRMEHELTEKITALFDAREVQKGINDRLFSTLERMEAKIDALPPKAQSQGALSSRRRRRCPMAMIMTAKG